MLGSRPGHLSLLPWNNLYAKLGFKVGDLTVRRYEWLEYIESH